MARWMPQNQEQTEDEPNELATYSELISAAIIVTVLILLLIVCFIVGIVIYMCVTGNKPGWVTIGGSYLTAVADALKVHRTSTATACSQTSTVLTDHSRRSQIPSLFENLHETSAGVRRKSDDSCDIHQSPSDLYENFDSYDRVGCCYNDVNGYKIMHATREQPRRASLQQDISTMPKPVAAAVQVAPDGNYFERCMRRNSTVATGSAAEMADPAISVLALSNENGHAGGFKLAGGDSSVAQQSVVDRLTPRSPAFISRLISTSSGNPNASKSISKSALASNITSPRLATVTTPKYKSRCAIPISLFPEHARRLNADGQLELEREFNELREINENMLKLASTAGRLPVPLQWPVVDSSSATKASGGSRASAKKARKMPIVSCDSSNTSANRAKNRYNNILVYEHSRVLLEPLSLAASTPAEASEDCNPATTAFQCSKCLTTTSKVGRLSGVGTESLDASGKTAVDVARVQQRADYINASWISDCTGQPGTYIATQGPLQHTAGDFWTLVWQQNVHNLIMLTNVIESCRTKCDIYWPQYRNRPVRFGNIEVELDNELATAFYVVRDFTVRIISNSSSSIANTASNGRATCSSNAEVYQHQQQRRSVFSFGGNSKSVGGGVAATSDHTSEEEMNLLPQDPVSAHAATPPAVNNSSTCTQQTCSACGATGALNSTVINIPPPSVATSTASGSASGKRLLFGFGSRSNSSNGNNSNTAPLQTIPPAALGSERIVRQWHYTDWPDHGRPSQLLPLLRFITVSSQKSTAGAEQKDTGETAPVRSQQQQVAVVNEKNSKSSTKVPSLMTSSTLQLREPLLLHCSAGVGRTGCYIVIHAMIQNILRSATIDVYNYVAAIRRERMGMVQTEAQYELIHDALLEYLQSGQTEVNVTQFAHYYADIVYPLTPPKLLADVEQRQQVGCSRFAQQLRLIAAQQPRCIFQPPPPSTAIDGERNAVFSAVTPAPGPLVAFAGKAATKFACARANASKNASQRYVPEDDVKSRVTITPLPAVFGSDYINASFVPGYFNAREYILTQFPQRSTVGDFWQMITDQRVPVVIVVHALASSSPLPSPQTSEASSQSASSAALAAAVGARRSGNAEDFNLDAPLLWPDKPVPLAVRSAGVENAAKNSLEGENDLTSLEHADRFVAFWPNPSLYQSSSPRNSRIDATIVDEIVMVAPPTSCNSGTGGATAGGDDDCGENEQQTMLVRERALKVALEDDDEFEGFPSVLLSIAPRINRNVGGVYGGAGGGLVFCSDVLSPLPPSSPTRKMSAVDEVRPTIPRASVVTPVVKKLAYRGGREDGENGKLCSNLIAKQPGTARRQQAGGSLTAVGESVAAGFNNPRAAITPMRVTTQPSIFKSLANPGESTQLVEEERFDNNAHGLGFLSCTTSSDRDGAKHHRNQHKPSSALEHSGSAMLSAPSLTTTVSHESIQNDYDDDSKHYCRVIELPFPVDGLAFAAAGGNLIAGNVATLQNVAGANISKIDCDADDHNNKITLPFIKVFLRLMKALRTQNLIAAPPPRSEMAANSQYSPGVSKPEHVREQQLVEATAAVSLTDQNLPAFLSTSSNAHSNNTDLSADVNALQQLTLGSLCLNNEAANDAKAAEAHEVRKLPEVSAVPTGAAVSASQNFAAKYKAPPRASPSPTPSQSAACVIMDEFGGAKAALLAALMSLYNQIECNGTVDIYSLCHMINNCRPNVIVGGMLPTSRSMATNGRNSARNENDPSSLEIDAGLQPPVPAHVYSALHVLTQEIIPHLSASPDVAAVEAVDGIEAAAYASEQVTKSN